MCAINPTHKKRLILDVYTSNPNITEDEFISAVLQYSLAAEQEMNSCTELRWHIKETDQQAD